VLELGCGLGLPSIVAARAGARVLATDGSPDAVAFAAHSLALDELDGEVARVDWSEQDGDVALHRLAPRTRAAGGAALTPAEAIAVGDRLELLRPGGRGGARRGGRRLSRAGWRSPGR
jgi:hypothetical protein